jgi:hypothetical protein
MVGMTLEELCKENQVRGRLNQVVGKLEKLQFLLECRQVELTIIRPGSQLYTEIHKEIKIIQLRLGELKSESLFSISARYVSEKEVVR